MLNNRRAVSLLEAFYWSLLVCALLGGLTMYLSKLAYESHAPAAFNGAAVFVVSLVAVFTSMSHWVIEQKAAWNLAHAQPKTEITVQGQQLKPRDIPRLDSNDNPYFAVTASNTDAHTANLAVHSLRARDIVDPPIPGFVTVTQMARLAYTVMESDNPNLTIREWTGTGKTFSDPQWRKLRPWMLERGFWAMKNDTKNSPVLTTQRGREWLQSIVVAFPAPRKTYRYKA